MDTSVSARLVIRRILLVDSEAATGRLLQTDAGHGVRYSTATSGELQLL
jgi:hypothetical protein